jgi:tRNA threonylcarbamoyl adenosine modification protein (Sua5/YciO/YrdC/YwlC family)
VAQYFTLHPEAPQPRLIRQAVQLLRQGGVLAVPTDSSYALACHLDDKDAATAIRRIRRLDNQRLLSLLCRDLSELSSYARVDNAQFRLLKAATPGPYTFILEASKEVPRRVSHPSRKTIGLRVPDHLALRALLTEHGAPLLASTLILPGDAADQETPLSDPGEIRQRLERQIAAVIDAGPCPGEPSTVIDLTGDAPRLIRAGRGDVTRLGMIWP